jgi:hypothetical protein
VTTRRFAPPWSAEVTPSCFIVRDANGQALTHIYYESEPSRRSAAKVRRIAAKYCEAIAAMLLSAAMH